MTFLQRLLLITFTLLLSACKTSPDTASRIQDTAGAPPAGVCPCEDLACWKQKTDTATVKQFECARDALKSAASLAGGFAADVAKIASGVIDISEALLAEDQALFKLFKGIAEGTEGAANILGKAAPVGECVARSARTVKDVFALLERLTSHKQGVDAEQFTSLLKMWGSAMDGSMQLGAALTACLDAAGQIGDDKGLAQLKKFMGGWGKTLATLNGVLAVVSCGPKIAEGGTVLIGNTMCLAGDLAKLEESRKRVERALAYDGSRAFNLARQQGCRFVEENNTWMNLTAEVVRDKCREACAASAEGVMGGAANKRAKYNVDCAMSCATAHSQGFFTTFTDVRNCEEVKRKTAENPQRVVYRHLALDLLSSGGSAKEKAEEGRGALMESLDLVEAAFAFIDACPGQGNKDGYLQIAELACCAEAKGALDGAKAASLGKACATLGQEPRAQNGRPYFFNPLDNATDGAPADGNVSQRDIAAFREEIKTYHDDSEL